MSKNKLCANCNKPLKPFPFTVVGESVCDECAYEQCQATYGSILQFIEQAETMFDTLPDKMQEAAVFANLGRSISNAKMEISMIKGDWKSFLDKVHGINRTCAHCSKPIECRDLAIAKYGNTARAYCCSDECAGEVG